MTQQNKRRAVPQARACAVHNVGQIVQQARIRGQATTRATGFTMAALVVAAHGKTPLVELQGDVLVAAGMFTQAMHQDHHTTQGNLG